MAILIDGKKISKEIKDELAVKVADYKKKGVNGAVYMDADNGDGTYDFRKMFTDIKPLIEKYDLKYYNQESIIDFGEYMYIGG